MIPHEMLTRYYTSGRLTRGRTVSYLLDRVQKVLEIMDALDVVGRTRYALLLCSNARF